MSEHVDESISEISRGYSKKDRLFSSITARLLFFLLFIADVFWGLYSFLFCLMLSVAVLCTFCKVACFKEVACSYWLSLKRASVCGISLFLALFSPSFGIMIACTYFLMYDKKGLEEVIPSSLQAQFKEFFTIE
jgi:hypothetical protein